MQLLPLRSLAPLPIGAHQIPVTGMRAESFTAAAGVRTSETLAKALVSEGVEILMARPMGKNGTVLINFRAPKPPIEVLYWSFVKHVVDTNNVPKATFPSEQTVCEKFGRAHGQTPENCPNSD
ncbi:hypothetical protein HPB48_021846 [Haemaphysalis longicornis]|uniref:Uncharacterized protein n=1 Tax=Haemaphysalis longicornis TaxID=44386 RepID=A0A9J6H5P6_HAELO|nr:hypothetical protein HPB48_021846 [Haemaphysalis longicornis]